jgi:hypothetical protein
MVNDRETQIIFGNDIINRKWREINVGDIIQLYSDDFVTVSYSISLRNYRDLNISYRQILSFYQRVNLMDFVILKQQN